MDIVLLPATDPKTGCALQITMFLANNTMSSAVAIKFWTAENDDAVCVCLSKDLDFLRNSVPVQG